MQMPPFMRNSNAGPLTLVPWQYDLLMAWVSALEAAPAPPVVMALAEAQPSAAAPMSDAAVARRAEVLARIAARNRQ
jgi:hypothetical protein